MPHQETEAYLAALDTHLREPFTALCDLIRSADERIDEAIKWNAPSFFITDHFASTGLARDGTIRLVLHTGAKKRPEPLAVVIDDGDLLTWAGTDRASITFADPQQIRQLEPILTSVIKQWIAQTQSAGSSS
ncbi:MAG TPA: DUF1801 domain-containing protein [Glaciibacter sp.]|nr:DUF1801 domain-containing protein [Glaciibacter sp.]